MARRKRRTFTAEFKDEAVKMVLERGLTVAQAARDLDVGETTLGRWVQVASQAAEAPEKALGWSEREELKRLRRENARLREEREILKKATAFFVREIK